jgi:small conductance mechanosensitive channel
MNSQSFLEYLHIPRELANVILILLLAWLVLVLSRRLIRVFHDYTNARAVTADERRRITTLARVFRYVAGLAVTLVAVMLVLSELGISIAPILGAAGVVGIAIGFGAQSLVKDFFNGLFILMENQIRQGDVVEVSGKTGVVEDMTLRYVKLRDYEGSVHYVPNGLITTVTNKSRGYAYAVIDVSIDYGADVDAAYRVMREVGAAMRDDPLICERIIEDIEIAGVQDWGDSDIVLRCRFKTVALEQWGIRREFLKRVKQAFDAQGIEIPYPHLTIVHAQDKGSSAEKQDAGQHPS